MKKRRPAALVEASNLKAITEDLEYRVQQRTQELEILNQALQLAREQAEHQARSKSRFLAAVGHDLMQPLSAARLFSSALKESTSDPQSAQFAEHIERALSTAEYLLTDLLDVSRLESGKLDTKVTDVLLADVLQPLASEFEILAKHQGIDFRVIETSHRITTDAKLLRRTLQNFLTNAFRYNPKGSVLLGVRRDQDKIRIEVWDNGPGIPIAQQKRIFEEFTRLDDCSGDSGLGLGLAIARGICRVLDHPIELRSWDQRGTVFSVTVPLAPQQIKIPSLSIPSIIELLPLQGLCVLCVDNELDIVQGMKALLSRWGCVVFIANTWNEAVCHLQASPISVVVSDYHLWGNRTGVDMLTFAKKQTPTFSMGIVISADRDSNIKQKVKAQGYCFLQKPLKPIKLRVLLNQCKL